MYELLMVVCCRYPPGQCGVLCNGHTFDCYMAEVHEACCDEEGLNCGEDQADIPTNCPVGCALVFPEFLETCRDHIREQDALMESDFESFERQCFDQDGLALVEYAMMMQATGCVLDFNLAGGGSSDGGH